MSYRRKLSKQESKAFLATETGQHWLARKIEQKNASRLDPGPAPERLTRTKFPFAATEAAELSTSPTKPCR